MAKITLTVGWKVICVLSHGDTAVVAVRAALGGLIMGKRPDDGKPSGTHVACLTEVRRTGVIKRFPGRLYAIMAGKT
jgi:hypothetical protein